MNTETRYAYCHACGNAVECDARGCVDCAERRTKSNWALNALASLLFWARVATAGKAS